MRDIIPIGSIYDIVEITPAHPDVERICEDLDEILNCSDDSCFACEQAAYNLAPIDVRGLVHDPREVVFVVLHGHNVCGGASVSRRPRPLFHTFCVRASMRGHGIGHHLLDHVHDRYPHTELHLRPYRYDPAPSPARLELNRRFEALLGLYEGHGYSVYDTSNPDRWVLRRDAPS